MAGEQPERGVPRDVGGMKLIGTITLLQQMRQNLLHVREELKWSWQYEGNVISFRPPVAQATPS